MKRSHNKTATIELTKLEWGIIVLALQEARTMPRKSGELAESLAELVAVQTKGVK
jgi:hypothetical protein